MGGVAAYARPRVVFTARRYAMLSAVYAVVVCLSVCMCACVSVTR